MSISHVSRPFTGAVEEAGIWIFLNGERMSVAHLCVADLLRELGFGEAKVATALNGAFLAAAARATTVLSAGDRLEVVSPRAGG
jgi:sulfur carrier protein